MSNKCEAFFRYINDRIEEAGTEIKSSLTVTTSEGFGSGTGKKAEKETPLRDDLRKGYGRRDTVIAGNLPTHISFSAFLH